MKAKLSVVMAAAGCLLAAMSLAASVPADAQAFAGSSSQSAAGALAVSNGGGVEQTFQGSTPGSYIAQHGNNIPAYAPSFSVGNICSQAVSGGASFLGFGATVGGTHKDVPCAKNKWFQTFWVASQDADAHGNHTVANMYRQWALDAACSISFMSKVAPAGACPAVVETAATTPTASRAAANVTPVHAKPLPPVPAARVSQTGVKLLPHAPAWCDTDGGARFEPACVGKAAAGS